MHLVVFPSLQILVNIIDCIPKNAMNGHHVNYLIVNTECKMFTILKTLDEVLR